MYIFILPRVCVSHAITYMAFAKKKKKEHLFKNPFFFLNCFVPCTCAFTFTCTSQFKITADGDAGKNSK